MLGQRWLVPMPARTCWGRNSGCCARAFLIVLLSVQGDDELHLPNTHCTIADAGSDERTDGAKVLFHDQHTLFTWLFAQ